jgi:putative transposase
VRPVPTGSREKGSAFPWPPLYVNFSSGEALPHLLRWPPFPGTRRLSITSVTRDRLPVFRTGAIKRIASSALNEARGSGRFAIFAYVIMPDHLHLITDGARKPSDTLRFINGIASHRVVGYLKEGGYTASLEKLRDRKKARGHRYSLWDGHSNVFLLTSESLFMQRVNYIHQNPVRAGLVAHAEDYEWSSARCWSRRTLKDEPLLMDFGQIIWRKPR